MCNQLDQSRRTLYSAYRDGHRTERKESHHDTATHVESRNRSSRGSGSRNPTHRGAAQKQASKAPTANGEPFTLPELLGLEDANTFVPKENPLTAKKVELGRLLF